MKIVIATTNAGKVREIAAILEEVCDPSTSFLGLIDAGLSDFDYKETGVTFAENAVGKAIAAAQAAGMPAIADDSGLCVDALEGAPGIRSARWAGDLANDSDRNRALLELMDGIPIEKRAARFVCAAALAIPDGTHAVAEGLCEGFISLNPRGQNGFGYDPIFYIKEYDRSMAELDLEIKNKISHRRKALCHLAELFNRFAVDYL